MHATGLAGAERAYVVARFFSTYRQPLVVLTATPAASQQFAADLAFFAGAQTLPVLLLPPPDLSGRDWLQNGVSAAAERIRVLHTLLNHRQPAILVTSLAALLPRLLPRRVLNEHTELLMPGEEVPQERLVEKMTACGYSHSLLVEMPGDFCVRGGILDVFSPLYDDPLRLEYFGDHLESLRFFSAATQRTRQHVAEAVIVPVREAILPRAQLPHLITALQQQAARQDLGSDRVQMLTERLKNEGLFTGLEALAPLLYTEMESLFDYLPPATRFILLEPAELQKQTEALWDKAYNAYRHSLTEAHICLEPPARYLDWPEIIQHSAMQHSISMRHLALHVASDAETETAPAPTHYHFDVSDNTAMHATLMQQHDRETLLTPLAEWLQSQFNRGFTTLMLCSTLSQIERLDMLLRPYGIHAERCAGFPDERHRGGRLLLCPGHLSSGFVWPAEQLAVITEDEIFGKKQRRRARPRRVSKSEQLTFGELQSGDLVVHREHGIGQYQGLVKLRIDGTTDDYVFMTYRGGDKLYLPVVRMNMIQKYLGVDDMPPRLDRMGGKTWERTRDRVKKSVEKIAGELLRLYAARKTAKGIAYAFEDDYFRDFEAAFAFEETPDQLQAITDVLEDMRAESPMDRLICGDVGYGKTEVALRAAFVAVNHGKQVAVVVPTTVLAEQHHATFNERLKRYPIQTACLSRFRKVREQKEIISGLRGGQIDIVIGTHRLLQKDVGFKDLGLVVLDEEHRFGVAHKEKLKKMRQNVDVLALTATPIPRTLHMSMTGIRDMSIISTPPEQRRAIITYVSEFENGVVTAAIRQELQRQGQIFFVHNTVHNIEAMAARLQTLVPEVRLDVAHGQMSEGALEKVMWRFMQREIDMLVCTTIIESGLDIPAANTILINRADRFGLAQIYQLRGRVGRADEQAYAYLFIPKETSLGKDAQKRLRVLMEHSDLGAGFQIAMSDLKIRGGGTILGASQSGHIAAVGYDMFLELMEEAIAEMKGETPQETLEPEIHIPISAYLPENYITDIDQRLLIYRRLARTATLTELSDIKDELADRFGALPTEASNLMLKMMLKIVSADAGVKRLDITEPWLFLTFSEAHQKNPFGLATLIAQGNGRYVVTPEGTLKIELSKRRPSGMLMETKQILKEIGRHVG